MFNTIGVTKGLTFSKIIGGLSKTLQIANQVIPLYQKAKPMIHNARNIMGVLKEFKKTSPNKVIEAKDVNVKTLNKEKNAIKKEVSTSPTFFL